MSPVNNNNNKNRFGGGPRIVRKVVKSEPPPPHSLKYLAAVTVVAGDLSEEGLPFPNIPEELNEFISDVRVRWPPLDGVGGR